MCVAKHVGFGLGESGTRPQLHLADRTVCGGWEVDSGYPEHWESRGGSGAALFVPRVGPAGAAKPEWQHGLNSASGAPLGDPTLTAPLPCSPATPVSCTLVPSGGH